MLPQGLLAKGPEKEGPAPTTQAATPTSKPATPTSKPATPTSKPATIAPEVLVLLPVEGDSKLDSLSSEINAISAKLGQKGQALALTLNDLLLAVGCDDRSLSCLQKIGQNVKATRMLLAQAVDDGEKGVKLTLRLFDVKGGSDRERLEVLLTLDPLLREPQLRKALAQAYGISAPQQALRRSLGGIDISASVEDVQIVLSGEERGVAPLALKGLPAGSYEITGSRPGYQSETKRIVVEAGKIARLHLALSEGGKRAPAPDYLGAVRTHTWIIGGVGLASLVTAAIFGADLVAQQHKLDNTAGSTPEQIAAMQGYKERGERDALVTNVLLGVGGGLVITAAVLSYFDYRGARPEKRQAQRLSPKISVGLSSVQMRLQF